MKELKINQLPEKLQDKLLELELELFDELEIISPEGELELNLINYVDSNNKDLGCRCIQINIKLLNNSMDFKPELKILN